MNDYYAFDTGHLAQAMAAVEQNATRQLRVLARRVARRCPVQTVQLTGAPVSTSPAGSCGTSSGLAASIDTASSTHS